MKLGIQFGHPNTPGLSGAMVTFLATVHEGLIRLRFFGRAIDDTDTERLAETERSSGRIERAAERRPRRISSSVSVSATRAVSSTSIARPNNRSLILTATVARNVTISRTSREHLPSPTEMGFPTSQIRGKDFTGQGLAA